MRVLRMVPGLALLVAAGVAQPLHARQGGVEMQAGRIVSLGDIGPGVLVLVDGEVREVVGVRELDLAAIERIEIVRGVAAERLYGAHARQKAILITTSTPGQAVPAVGPRGIRIGSGGVIAWGEVPSDVVVILDGAVSTVAAVEGIQAGAIDRIEVIRGVVAERMYGARAAGGVVLIATTAGLQAAGPVLEPGIRIGDGRTVALGNVPLGVLIMLDGQVSDVSAIEAMDGGSIRSVQVIKGAAARSLYGSRASEGVILITSNAVN